MNEDEANTLLNRVLSIDKVLFEQQLGINWTPPLLKPLKKEELQSYKKAVEVLQSNHKSNLCQYLNNTLFRRHGCTNNVWSRFGNESI